MSGSGLHSGIWLNAFQLFQWLKEAEIDLRGPGPQCGLHLPLSARSSEGPAILCVSLKPGPQPLDTRLKCPCGPEGEGPSSWNQQILLESRSAAYRTGSQPHGPWGALWYELTGFWARLAQ